MKKSLLLVVALAILALPVRTTAQTETPKSLTLGLVAKAQSNAVFQAARRGAEVAAVDLGKKYGIAIKIDWRTPNDENAQQQADNIEQLVLAGANGIAVSCSDANKVTGAINDAVKNGVPVVTFDSDAPQSMRFATYGTADKECGELIMDELGKEIGGKGVVAILAGNQNAPNLQARAKGVRDECAKKFPGITILDTYYHKETPADAAAKVEQVMEANPQITGWAMIGGWPLFTKNALKWAPGTVKCVAVDALRPELSYLEDGHVNLLLAQQCYMWGYQSVTLLVDKIVNHKTPPAAFVPSPLILVTKDTLADYKKKLDVWMPE
jgi:ribose transport system substrate-binding protein